VNLRNASKEDVLLVMRWWSDPEYMGEYQDTRTFSIEELEKVMLRNTIFFVIEKKDGMKIGHIGSWMWGKTMEMGFALVPSERRKGYGEEAIQLMVDYLFLTKDIVRIQVSTDTENKASQRALERVGFIKEGIMRKSGYTGGEYRDHYLYSVLREEWKEPRILTKTA
jgi:RimJ/RimL family protein N-acetyltransferase